MRIAPRLQIERFSFDGPVSGMQWPIKKSFPCVKSHVRQGREDLKAPDQKFRNCVDLAFSSLFRSSHLYSTIFTAKFSRRMDIMPW